MKANRTMLAAAVLALAGTGSGFTASDTARQSWPARDIRLVGCLTRNGSIEVSILDTNRICIETVRSAGAEDSAAARELLAEIDVSVRVEPEDSVLGIEVWMPDSKTTQASFRITVPREMDLELETSMGGIKVDSVTGEIEVKVDLGGIELQHTTGPAELACGLGPVYLEDHSGPAHVRVETGPIECVFREPGPGDTIDLESDLGPVKVSFPKDAPARLEARCHLGKVTVEDLTVAYEARSDAVVMGWLGPEGKTNRVLYINSGKGSVLVTGTRFTIESDVLKDE